MFVGHDHGLPSQFEREDTIAGRALSEGVVIDLSQMRTVTVDPDQRTAHSWSNDQ